MHPAAVLHHRAQGLHRGGPVLSGAWRASLSAPGQPARAAGAPNEHTPPTLLSGNALIVVRERTRMIPSLAACFVGAAAAGRHIAPPRPPRPLRCPAQPQFCPPHAWVSASQDHATIVVNTQICRAQCQGAGLQPGAAVGTHPFHAPCNSKQFRVPSWLMHHHFLPCLLPCPACLEFTDHCSHSVRTRQQNKEIE